MDHLADAQSSLARLAGEVEAEEALLVTVGEQVEEEKQRVLRQVRGYACEAMADSWAL